MNKLELVKKEDRCYKVTRLNDRFFSDSIIRKSQKTILKDYVYLDAYIVIA